MRELTIEVDKDFVKILNSGSTKEVFEEACRGMFPSSKAMIDVKPRRNARVKKDTWELGNHHGLKDYWAWLES